MLPENLEWYFPGSVEEAEELVKKPGIQMHSGGTRILKLKSDNIKALVDVGKMKLDYISYSDNAFYIGAAATFSEVVSFFRQRGKLPILSESLFNSASTPLRNRITIGGSIKDFPIWSSLYAPLIAIDAKVEISGEGAGIYPVEMYAGEKIINGRHIVKQLIIDDKESLIGRSKRFSVIKFEYPIFNISVSFNYENKLLQNMHLVITGVRSRFQRFREAEEFLNGKSLTDDNINKACEMISADLCSDYRYSGEYKRLVARVYFKDLLIETRRIANESFI